MDNFLILQRLCEAFKKAEDEGRYSMTVNEFIENSNFRGPERELVFKQLKEVEKEYFEIDNDIIIQTKSGKERCIEIRKRYGGKEEIV